MSFALLNAKFRFCFVWWFSLPIYLTKKRFRKRSVCVIDDRDSKWIWAREQNGTHTIRWTPNQILTEQTIGAIRFSCWIRFFSFLLFSTYMHTHTGRRVRDTRHGRQRCVVASTVYSSQRQTWSTSAPPSESFIRQNRLSHTFTRTLVCARQCYNRSVIFSIARIFVLDECCTLVSYTQSSMVPCLIPIVCLAVAPCDLCCVLVYRVRERDFACVLCRTHTHIRGMKMLLPALPMSASASRWIAGRKVYSNVANDVDWLANTLRRRRFFLFFPLYSCAIQTHLITVAVVVIRLSGSDDVRCVLMQEQSLAR